MIHNGLYAIKPKQPTNQPTNQNITQITCNYKHFQVVALREFCYILTLDRAFNQEMHLCK